MLLIVLFVVSVIFFSVEVRLRKLLGVVPVLASFFFMYCWSKVYELFCYISLMSGPTVTSVSPFCELHPPPPYCLPLPPPGLRHHSEDISEEEEGGEGVPGLGTEFYPVDPLSRGMMDRLVALNRNMYGSTYVPFHNDDDYISQVKNRITLVFLSLNDSLQKSETEAGDISGEGSRGEQFGRDKISAKYKTTLTVEI